MNIKGIYSKKHVVDIIGDNGNYYLIKFKGGGKICVNKNAVSLIESNEDEETKENQLTIFDVGA